MYYEKHLAQLVRALDYSRGRKFESCTVSFSFTKYTRKVMEKMEKWIGRSKLFLKRNSSTILTCVGGAGVVATAVMAVKATPKALYLIEEAREEKGEELTKFEIVKAAGPVYIPTILVGASTIACVLGANILNHRQQASIVSAYALLDNTYKDYKKKVEELYGEGAHDNVRSEIAKDKYVEVADMALSPDKELFYDGFGDRYFESTKHAVQFAEYQINREINMRGWVTVNEFYEWLDIDPIDGGDALGWSEGGNLARYWQGWVDFDHHKVVLDDGLECRIISIVQEPYLNFEDDF